jgi:hypothetical protein
MRFHEEQCAFITVDSLEILLSMSSIILLAFQRLTKENASRIRLDRFDDSAVCPIRLRICIEELDLTFCNVDVMHFTASNSMLFMARFQLQSTDYDVVQVNP